MCHRCSDVVQFETNNAILKKKCPTFYVILMKGKKKKIQKNMDSLECKVFCNENNDGNIVPSRQICRLHCSRKLYISIRKFLKLLEIHYSIIKYFFQLREVAKWWRQEKRAQPWNSEEIFVRISTQSISVHKKCMERSLQIWNLKMGNWLKRLNEEIKANNCAVSILLTAITWNTAQWTTV